MNAVAAQAASLLLRYPDARALSALPAIEAALDELPRSLANPLRVLATHRRGDPEALAVEYVDLFDHHPRHCLYLSYYTGGDTRNRGAQLVEFAAAYRVSGFEPDSGELPDFLPAVLELAAQAGEPGWDLLRRYRIGLDLLSDSLKRAHSPYQWGIAAVLSMLPKATATETAAASGLAQSGPPREDVGLEPFALSPGGRR